MSLFDLYTEKILSPENNSARFNHCIELISVKSIPDFHLSQHFVYNSSHLLYSAFLLYLLV